MKPPPLGIVWSGRRRTCPRCRNVVDVAYAVAHPDGTRTWSCVACLTVEDRGGDGRRLIYGPAGVLREAKIGLWSPLDPDPGLQGLK